MNRLRFILVALLIPWLGAVCLMGAPERIDGATSVSRVIYEADYRGTNTFDGQLLLWEKDEQGVETTYAYDSLKRLVTRTKAGVGAAGGFPSQSDITTTFTYDAHNRLLSETVSAGGLSLSNSAAFDLAGRPTRMDYSARQVFGRCN